MLNKTSVVQGLGLLFHDQSKRYFSLGSDIFVHIYFEAAFLKLHSDQVKPFCKQNAGWLIDANALICKLNADLIKLFDVLS